MNTSSLLESNFLEIFANHEIVNWKTKDFLENITFDTKEEYEEKRNQMYIDLNKLVQQGYLKKTSHPSYSSLKLYTATLKANELKPHSTINIQCTTNTFEIEYDSPTDQYATNSLETEYYSLTDQLIKNRIQLKYCNSLKTRYAHLSNNLKFKIKLLNKKIFELEVKREFLYQLF
jgi:hypothetical protein